MEIHDGKIDLSSPCNLDCHCSGFAYTPVCRVDTGDTFFSPCVASCNAYSKTDKVSVTFKTSAAVIIKILLLFFSFITNVNAHEISHRQSM